MNGLEVGGPSSRLLVLLRIQITVVGLVSTQPSESLTYNYPQCYIYCIITHTVLFIICALSIKAENTLKIQQSLYTDYLKNGFNMLESERFWF